MKTKKILSILLTLVMVIGSIGVTGYAAMFESSAAYADKVDEDGNPIIDYISKKYETPEAKLNDMKLMKEQDGYKLYVEEFTGEVAFINTKTGESLFSNPYDISAGYNWASASTKQKLLSQLVVTYEKNGVASTMYSYVEAALRGQITIKNIKNGMRVEYTVGELATTRLVPRMISTTRFESMVLNNITNETYKNKLMSFYHKYDTSDKSLTERNVKEIQASFPITKKFAVYVCDPDIASKELKTLETIVKTFCPNYTYEEMDQDHSDCDYTATDEAPANFKMAIEYTISGDGIEARLPANGIRFDESNFTLKSITMLPYMGCGSSENTGYTFIPDGSGTLIRFENVKNSTYNVAGQIYGSDYAYHTISGQHSEIMKMPVFGVVENFAAEDGENGTQQSAAQAAAGTQAAAEAYDRGFLAIITEGDSMATLMSEHGGQLHCYNTVYATFDPRPSDSYNLADSISVGSNSSWTVTSDRKYSGSYRIKYVMLSDANKASKAGLSEDEFYKCSYVGMADAYRDYLIDTGVLTKLTSDDVKDDVPLYVETFGSIKTTEKVLSFPVEVDTPLTTFDDIKTMSDELSEEGVSNLNFRLTGYYNGGLDNSYLTSLKWVGAIGGKSGFKDLLNYASENGVGIYPEFDFAYLNSTSWFDGVSQKRDLVKSIDDRYMSKREYDAATQSFESDFALAVSASVYDYFYGKFEKNYSKYDAKGISVSTMGTDLNSDFDGDDPYNREDSKKFTTDLLSKLSENYSVMVNGGNAYTISYADHIIDIPTESSDFLKASESVPFIAMVLHGYVNYTGSAINMEGDVQYSLLKDIENGASLYFTLVYQNSSSLKESDKYNKFYSVSYDIWKDDIVKYYGMINDALSDVQTSVLSDHEFLEANRVVGEDEAEVQLTEEEIQSAAEEQKKKEEDAARKALRDALVASRGDTTSSAISDNDSSGVRGQVAGNATSKVATESGSVVRVAYDNGVQFIINYNSFDINVSYGGETYTIGALDFTRIDANNN